MAFNHAGAFFQFELQTWKGVFYLFGIPYECRGKAKQCGRFPKISPALYIFEERSILKMFFCNLNDS